MQSDILLSHSLAMNIFGAEFEYSEALRVFGGEKREKGVIKTEVERKEEKKRGNLKKRRRDKDLLGIVMQLFLTFRNLAAHCPIPN